MNFEKVRDAVLGEARKEAEALLNEARARADALREEARRSGETALEAAVREARARAERETDRAVGRARLQGRLRVLAARNEVLDRIFRRAEELFHGLDEKERLDFLRAWLSALPGSVGGVIRVCPEDAERMDSRFLSEVNKDRPAEGRFTEVVADRSVQAGFLIEGENYVLDATLAQRLARLRTEAAGPIAEEALGK